MQTVAWDQRFGRRFFFKARLSASQRIARVHRRSGSRAAACSRSASIGESKYWELETTGRYLASEYRDLTVSYVRSHSTRDLNDYDQFFGNFRNPIIRSNANNPQPDRRSEPTDRPRHHRFARQVGVLAALRVADGIPLVGGRRVSGFRRHAQPSRPAPDGVDPRLLARPALALQESASSAGIKIYNPSSRQRA